jgi:hypothetical protein
LRSVAQGFVVYQLLGEDWTDRSSARHVWNTMNLFNVLFVALVGVLTLLWVLRWHEQGVMGHLSYVVHQVAISMPQCAVSITFVFFGTTHALQYAIDNLCMWEVRGCWMTCVCALQSTHGVSPNQAQPATRLRTACVAPVCPYHTQGEAIGKGDAAEFHNLHLTLTKGAPAMKVRLELTLGVCV